MSEGNPAHKTKSERCQLLKVGNQQMNTETKILTPESAGLTLAVLSGPRGAVRDEWPCIEYTCQLSDSRRRVIWTGEFRLGVGHVKWPNLAQLSCNFHTATSFLTAGEQNVARIEGRGQTLKKTPEALQVKAGAAAKLATRQHVKPSLNDVCHSLLMDGAAFFDGYRFKDWANEYGYSDDSIKAKETFEACDRIGRDLARALSLDEISALREWASNF